MTLHNNNINALFLPTPDGSNGKLANRAERRAQGWRGPLPPNIAEHRDKTRRYVGRAERVKAKLDDVALRLGIQ